MSRIVLNKASGTDYVPDVEDWWGDFDDSVPPPPIKQPKLRLVENPTTRPSAASRKKAAGRNMQKIRLEKRINQLLMMMTAVVLVTGLFVQISRMAQISAQSKQIAELNTEIRNLEGNYQNLQVRLSMQENIERVSNEAVNRLGMVYPEGDALRIVNLPGYYTDTEAKTADNSGAEDVSR